MDYSMVEKAAELNSKLGINNFHDIDLTKHLETIGRLAFEYNCPGLRVHRLHCHFGLRPGEFFMTTKSKGAIRQDIVHIDRHKDDNIVPCQLMLENGLWKPLTFEEGHVNSATLPDTISSAIRDYLMQHGLETIIGLQMSQDPIRDAPLVEISHETYTIAKAEIQPSLGAPIPTVWGFKADPRLSDGWLSISQTDCYKDPHSDDHTPFK